MAEKEGHHDTDELSGVLQPQPFKKQAARALEKCNKDNIPASLGVIEIEHYDQLDDRYGGHSKQQVLAELGYLLSIRFRTTDLRGMLKDGTFAIIFPGESSTTTKGALALLQEEIAQSSFAGASGDPFYVAVKTGVADAGKDGLTFDSLAKCAIQRAANSRSMQQSRITSSLPRLPIS
jgi:diguanylate cyclase (GGDEF)-like protein